MLLFKPWFKPMALKSIPPSSLASNKKSAAFYCSFQELYENFVALTDVERCGTVKCSVMKAELPLL